MNQKMRDWLLGKDTNVQTKDKWIYVKLSNLPDGSSILDAGAGTGKWKKACKHLKYTSQDFAQYNGTDNAVGLQNKEWNYDKIDIVSDITEIPVSDESFDAVLCSEVLEHVKDPNKALQELVRVTKKGGVLILTSPFCSLTHMAPYHFCSGFNKYWFEENLRDCGAEVIECTRNGDYYGWIRQEITRLPSIIQRYSGKNSLFIKIKCALFTHWINKYTKRKNESGELLCFQYLIMARKMES